MDTLLSLAMVDGNTVILDGIASDHYVGHIQPDGTFDVPALVVLNDDGKVCRIIYTAHITRVEFLEPSQTPSNTPADDTEQTPSNPPRLYPRLTDNDGNRQEPQTTATDGQTPATDSVAEATATDSE